MRWILAALPLLFTMPAAAQTCALSFTVEVTQGVGLIRPGTLLPGTAQYSTSGQSFRQDGGAMGHLATGQMTIGDEITGPIWTLVTTARGNAAELIGVYAQNIEGLTYAGVEYDGPMALTFYGAPGSRVDPTPPSTQAEWDAMDVRRVLTLHAGGADMLAGDVFDLSVDCR